MWVEVGGGGRYGEIGGPGVQDIHSSSRKRPQTPKGSPQDPVDGVERGVGSRTGPCREFCREGKCQL